MNLYAAQIVWTVTVALVSWWVGTHWHCPPTGCGSRLCPDGRRREDHA